MRAHPSIGLFFIFTCFFINVIQLLSERRIPERCLSKRFVSNFLIIEIAFNFLLDFTNNLGVMFVFGVYLLSLQIKEIDEPISNKVIELWV